MAHVLPDADGISDAEMQNRFVNAGIFEVVSEALDWEFPALERRLRRWIFPRLLQRMKKRRKRRRRWWRVTYILVYSSQKVDRLQRTGAVPRLNGSTKL